MAKQNVRERIIAAASRLFYFEGYNQTGINQIIAESGVAKSSMYQTFRSKEELAVVYLQRRHAMWMGLLEEATASTFGVDKILASFDFLEEWLVDVEFRGCGFQNIITDLPEGQERISNQVRMHKNGLQRWIRDILDDEMQMEAKSDQLSKEIMVLIEGAIILTQIQQEVWPIRTAKESCRKLV